MNAHSAEGSEEEAVAVAVLDSADYSTLHTKQVEVQLVTAVTAPMDSDPNYTAVAAKAAVAVQLHSDLRFDWSYCL